MKKMKSTRKKKKNDRGNKFNNYTIPVRKVGATLDSNNQMVYPNQQKIQVMQPGYPNQQVIPYTGYPPNQEYDQQPQMPQIDYSLIASINQLQHQSIFEAEQNTLFITLGSCYKVFPFIFLIIGAACIPLGIIYVKGSNKYIVIVLGAVFLIASIYMMCRGWHSVYFLMGPNNLTVSKKAVCGTSTTIYGPGEIISIKLSHYTTHKRGRKSRTRKTYHNYQLDITTASGNDRVFKVQQRGVLFTYEEMEYFNYTINFHIQTKMRIM